jgi:predicted Zn-dependent protease
LRGRHELMENELRKQLVSCSGGQRPMRTPHKTIFLRHMMPWLISLSLLATTACTRAPVTQRAQLNVIPDPLMRSLGKSAYDEMLVGLDLEKKSEDSKTLNKVGKKISRIASKPKYGWRYSLIDDDETINAWCLPGGKIAFYKGILPVLKNEAGMGFVMGHEVGHAVAHHSAERLTQQATVLGGLTVLYMHLDKNTDLPEESKNILMAALGVGLEVGIMLPFSRKHEKEADIIGMMYMARAGYPPEEAVQVWSRMRKQAGKTGVPTFLSTHPSHNQRKQNLRDWLPQAKKRYARNKLERDTQATLWRTTD